ncbi:acyltransferase [Aliidongia dinghuensis]|uniref:Acyltransferase n=1 Tax=Aliidongia dinghuensis TaxID=1867774 RepID=A0A8J2YR49_9PROT|nr:acyltransferase [Aliidongia dinghuensis]
MITAHTGTAFAELPYPLKRLTNFGWNGVQLFFLMSCVTLLMSWRSEETDGRASALDFYVRRMFRISPMYYLAALFYFLVEPPPTGFDLKQLLAALAFVNAWHPALAPTVLDRWNVVPGGWSISVEFMFYFMFPLMAALVRSMRAALLFCGLAVLAGCVVNPVMEQALRDNYSTTAVQNFLYFWFPNQISVFALGTVLYFILLWVQANPLSWISAALRRHSAAIICACLGACAISTALPFPERLPFSFPLLIPTFLVASLIFVVIVAAMATSPRSPFVNRFACELGKVSFSAYLFHFAVLHELPRLLPILFDTDATGWRAIFSCFALWLATVSTTYGLSAITFHTVEDPMIRMGRRLLRLRRKNDRIATAGQAS